MTNLSQDIKDKLKRLTAFEKIIALNIFIYVIGWFIWRLNEVTRDNSLDWIALPKEFSDFIIKPWTIFTYGFAHVNFWHLAINMMILYFVGRSFSNLFNVKLSLNVFFLGILAGGILFVLTSLLVPVEYFVSVSGIVGASAGVHAALIFLCTYMPDYEVRLVSFNLKLKYIAFVLVALDILGLFGDNRGGNIAHIGGDVLGYFYATRLRQGTDIGKGFEKIVNGISSWFSKSSKGNLKTVYKKKKAFAGHTKEEFSEFNNQKQIDIILDKISKSGYDSLSSAEKEFLFKSGKK